MLFAEEKLREVRSMYTLPRAVYISHHGRATDLSDGQTISHPSMGRYQAKTPDEELR
jgi:hypothetical protein